MTDRVSSRGGRENGLVGDAKASIVSIEEKGKETVDKAKSLIDQAKAKVTK